MSILKIARLGHPILCKKAPPVDNISDPNITKLIHDMTETKPINLKKSIFDSIELN